MYRAITKIQQSCPIWCTQCTLYYPKKWYDATLHRCLFCTFSSPTYHDVLKELEWQFIKSGDSDRIEYVQEYLKHMKNWCRHYHIEPSKEDRQIEKDIEY